MTDPTGTKTGDDPELKDYEAEFTMVLPGNAKASVHKIHVAAYEPIVAIAKAIDEWKARTEPRDVRVREVPKKGSAEQQ